MFKSSWLLIILLCALVGSAVYLEMSEPKVPETLSSQTKQKQGFDPLDELETTPYGNALIELMKQLRSSPQQFIESLQEVDAQFPEEKTLVQKAYRLTLLKYHAFLQNKHSDMNAYHQQLMMLAKKHDLKWLKVELMVDDAISDARYGKITQGLVTIKEAIALALEVNATYILPKAYNTAGVLSNNDNQLLEAQRYFLLGVDATKNARKTSFNASIHNNLGLLYLHIEKWDTALEYIEKAEELSLLSELNNNRALHIIYLNQAHIYNKQGKVKQALAAFEQSLPYFENVKGSPRHNLLHLKSRSDLALMVEDYRKAEKYALKCINYPDSESLPLEFGQCKLLLSKAQLALGKKFAALKSVEESINIFRLAEQNRWIIRGYQQNAAVYEKLGESKRALEFYKLYYTQDKQQLLSKVYDLEHAFATQSIQRERDLLDAQNQLAHLELSKEKLRFQMACLMGFVAVVALFALIKRMNIMQSKNRELETLSNIDQLTGLYNRRFYEHELKDCQRLESNCEYHIALFDLDNFKAVNDIHGHDVGDEVLTEAAQRFKQFVADEELVVRWGGEEFLMLFKHEQNIFDRIEKVRKYMALRPFSTKAGELPITTSIGVSSSALPAQLSESDGFFRKADQNLYEAKRSGKNRTVLSD